MLSSIFFVALLMGGDSHRLPHNVKDAPGAMIEDLGKVFPITSHVEARFSLLPLRNASKLMLYHRDQLISLRDNLTIDPSLDAHDIRLFNRILSSTIAELNSFVGPLTPTGRARRGLFNFVGNFAHVLFGVVDDDTLTSEFRKYKESLSSVVHSFDSSAHAVNTLAHNVQELATDFKAVRGKVGQIVGTVNKVSHLTSLTLTVFSYQSTVNKITQRLNSLATALIRAAHGEVSPDVISPVDMGAVLKRVSSFSVKTLFPLRQRTRFYASLRSFLTASGLSVIIPVRPSTIFRAYRVHPFPHKTNSSYYMVHVPHTFILRELGGHALSFPSSDFLDSCLKPTKDTFVCFSSPLPSSLQTPSCARALVSGGLITSLCSFEEVRDQLSPFMLSLSQATLIYFYQSTAATIACEELQPDRLLQGTFVLPHHCGLRSLSLKVPAIKSFVTDVTADPIAIRPALLTLPTINVTIPELHLRHVSKVQDADVGLMSDFHINFIYPVYVTLLGMLLLLLVFGACYAKAYRMHKEEDRIGSKAIECASSCPPYHGPILVQQQCP